MEKIREKGISISIDQGFESFRCSKKGIVYINCIMKLDKLTSFLKKCKLIITILNK
jgi:hypothetical protein